MITEKDLMVLYKKDTGREAIKYDENSGEDMPTVDYTSWLSEKTITYLNLLNDLKTLSNPDEEE